MEGQITVIGSGFSGTLVATHLLRKSRFPLHLRLIERRASTARGTAYSTPWLCHLLNVPAGKMSALPEDPSHFLKWLRPRNAQAHFGTFAPRRVYGDYLQDLLDETIRSAPKFTCLEKIHDEAVAIERKRDGLEVFLNSGSSFVTQKIVLALGNFQPGNLGIPGFSFDSSQRYVRDPWTEGRLESIPVSDSVFLIGTGLTMVDIALALKQKGHRGPIVALSRHGLLPQAHVPIQDTSSTLNSTVSFVPEFVSRQRFDSLVSMSRSFRAAIEEGVRKGLDWRTVFDSIRPHHQRLWKSLSIQDQRRFLRHLRVYWDVHRHRIAPEVARSIEELRASSQLSIYAGRIQRLTETREDLTVEFVERHSGIIRRVSCHCLINCTGPDYRYDRIEMPLIQDLRNKGWITPHPLGLGIQTSGSGALLDAAGHASADLFTLGTSQLGDLWETIAVPELRVRAAALAETLMSL